jgi:dienelactone hydrolase
MMFTPKISFGLLLGVVLTLVGFPPGWSEETKPPRMRFSAKTPTEADRWQRESRRLLFNLLKLSDLAETRQNPEKSIPFDVKVLRSEDRGKYLWSERELNSTPTRRIKFVLTIPRTPKDNGKSPAVVCIHGHGGSRFIVYQKKSLYNGFATDLAERGFVTISTDVGQHQVYEKDRSLMGERLWDVLRCADYVAGLPEVDSQRLGCAGLSLGGEMAMWLGAIDPRMKVTVSSGFLTTMANMRQGHCPCWEFPGLADNFDFSDIYSLTAPRFLLCQNGQKEGAPGGFPVKIAQQVLAEIQKAYAVYGCKNHADLDVHPGGHIFVTPTGLGFIEKHL